MFNRQSKFRRTFPIYRHERILVRYAGYYRRSRRSFFRFRRLGAVGYIEYECRVKLPVAASFIRGELNGVLAGFAEYEAVAPLHETAVFYC